jgi:GH25 family lysozyme M1 (1,4-beta-N-acetylmuramidase)
MPFDPQAASLYGQFVQAAYTMYDSAPDNTTPPPSPDFPAGFRMVAWIHMQDFVLESTAPLFYGFIAEREAVAGQLVVALRGTSNGIEWWDDFNALELTPFKNPEWGQVGAGFDRIYSTLEVIPCPVVAAQAMAAAAPRTMKNVGSFAQQVSALASQRSAARTPARGAAARNARAAPPPSSPTVEVTGHSLGAALATLYAMENANSVQIPNPMLCTFGSPLVGDATFAAAFNAIGLTSWRIDNIKDLVTKVPPAFLGFVHVDQEEQVDSTGKVVPDWSCWHALSTYLSLIDPSKEPAAACQLPQPDELAPPLAAPNLAFAAAAAHPVQVNRPFVIDLYHGDNVQDTPGPLGGFARVKAAGIAFLIHKATEGLTAKDARYQARRAAWMNGIPVSVTDVTGEVLQITPRFAAYHFFHGEDPKAEAEFFLKTAQLQHGDDAVVDWEAVGGSGFIPGADAVDEFCNVVEAELGFPIIVYSGNAAKEKLSGKDPRFARRRLWLAEYGSNFSVQQTWSGPWLWQNNGGQKNGNNTIPGIDGNCDNSTIAAPMTIRQLLADWGGRAQVQPLQSPPPIVSFASPALSWNVSLPEVRPLPNRRKTARFGWKRDLPDQRDHSYAVPAQVLKSLPSCVNLQSQCPPVYTQGDIGSCTANAIAAALEFDMMKQNSPSLTPFTPSRLFIYYNERNMEGTVPLDAGAQIRDGIKSVASMGDCPEALWTYDATMADTSTHLFPPGAKATRQPDQSCYDNAVIHKALSYQSVDQNLADMKGCLYAGYPFVFGFSVYPSFFSADYVHGAAVPMPQADESSNAGHAVLAVGYDDSRNMFIVRNSWGDSWGMKGYFYMPYAYLLDDNLADDFWTIRLVA